MNLEDVRARWTDERKRYEGVRALVRADHLIESFLDDLDALAQSHFVETVTLTEASLLSGYSRQYLGRLVSGGTLRNYGRPRAPRVRPEELPRKPSHLPPTTDSEHVSLTSRGQVVRSVLEGSTE